MSTILSLPVQRLTLKYLNLLEYQMKTCSKCGVSQPFSNFHKRSGTKNGYVSHCKSCRTETRKTEYWKDPEKLRNIAKEARLKDPEKFKLRSKIWKLNNPDKVKNGSLKLKYNISIEDFNLMMKNQNRCCAICKESFVDAKSTHVDHSHDSGKVRSILCKWCNLGLGHFKDNIYILKSAIEYLEYRA